MNLLNSGSRYIFFSVLYSSHVSWKSALLFKIPFLRRKVACSFNYVWLVIPNSDRFQQYLKYKSFNLGFFTNCTFFASLPLLFCLPFWALYCWRNFYLENFIYTWGCKVLNTLFYTLTCFLYKGIRFTYINMLFRIVYWLQNYLNDYFNNFWILKDNKR